MIESQDLHVNMRNVPLDQVEAELDRMWRDANRSAVAAGGYAAARASVMTLVAYTYTEEQAQRAQKVIEAMGTSHPSRIIIVATPGTREGPAIEAYVSAHTHTVGTNISYSEQILVEARDGAARHVPGAVLPLILSGLPSFLWWSGEPAWKSAQLESLVDGVDRVVIDTSEMEHPEQSLVAQEDLVRRKKSSTAFSDFNWTRGNPWRELVAGFFDAQSMRKYLDGIDQVTIEYAAGAETEETNASAAYLFAGWLASRLGWRIQSNYRARGLRSAHQHTMYSPLGQVVTIDINARFGLPIMNWQDIAPDDEAPGADGRTRPAAVGPGALVMVHIHSKTEDGQTATFAVAREQDLRHASTLAQVPGQSIPSQTVHLRSIGETSILLRQLSLLTHDLVYEDALSIAAHLIGPSTGRLFA